MIRFLWSIEADQLDGPGWAVTLTLGATPPSSDEWGRLRDQQLRRWREAGATRVHWLTEWTSIGRPHLHACVYGIPHSELPHHALAWMKHAQSRGYPASWRGQHIEPIRDATGWLKYVAKHSARGVDHYQRTSAPEGWEKTGRLWGQSGDWPRSPELVAGVSAAQLWTYMGKLRAWQAARMRREGVPEPVVQAFEVAPRELRGMSGWIPYDESVRLLLESTELPDWEQTHNESE